MHDDADVVTGGEVCASFRGETKVSLCGVDLHCLALSGDNDGDLQVVPIDSAKHLLTIS